MPFFSPEEPYNCGCYGAKYGIYSPNNALLPFVLNLPLESMRAFSISIVNPDTGQTILCVASSDVPHLLYTVNGVFVYVYNGEPIPGLRMKNGQRYVVELLGFKSCPIYAAIELDCFLKIQLGNSNEVFGLPYHRGWKQWVYVNAELNNWKWESYSVIEKDELGRNTTTQARLEKIWNIDLFDMPEWVYRALVTASILDNIELSQGIIKVTSYKKRGTAELDKGIVCEKTLVLTVPEVDSDQTDGLCTSTDEWIDIATELPVDACNSDVWVPTGRTRCLPILPVVACLPVPVFTSYSECASGAGNIILQAQNTPDGDTALYSIDNGSSFLESNVFTSLPVGNYVARVRFREAGCMSDPISINIPCGNGETPVWDATGTIFCLSVSDTAVDWQTTGNEFCISIFSDLSTFSNRAIAEVCEEVLTNPVPIIDN